MLADLVCREDAPDGDWKSKLQAPVKDSRVQTEVSSGFTAENTPR